MSETMVRFLPTVDMEMQAKFNWPEGAVAYHLEMIGGDNVLITGEIPIGEKKDGRPKFGPRRNALLFKGVLPLSRYRELLKVPG